MMKRIGITGTIASGKTTVAYLCKKKGFLVFHSDSYAKLAYRKDSDTYKEMVNYFSNDILDAYGEIDYKKLSQCIFGNEEKRLKVNSIVHPFVRRGIRHFFESHPEQTLIFAEVPLLFEAGFEDLFDHIMVVTCDSALAIERLIRDRSYSKEEAIARYESQIAPEIQVLKGDEVIYNDYDLTYLNNAVNEWILGLLEEERK